MRPWDQNQIDFHTTKLKSDQAHWEPDSLEFCIALKIRDFCIYKRIARNLSLSARDALDIAILFPEKKVPDYVIGNYFDKYVSSDPRTIGEFFGLFLKTKTSLNRFQATQNSFKKFTSKNNSHLLKLNR